ncbi:lipopolysaccharide heptosyltransferase I [Biformimicrobium ophioploci]|uniref:Lipopolysaccharide heptosyltransferase 1 n=1 Tax=Biformimicrobium ophioploci TaxID=3036711 RepID=A0ABQ6M0R5_9GAMM|nr:lipopolysaccharide heptosyltransferase I [Microbulbifer sp. NKW57]GMG87877.1 lipopolysaccharide heptosyltransferase I [Microbulbifer sp. NKW57]
MRVLIVKTSSLGDVVHTLPAVTEASRAITELVFDWVVEENFAEIPGWHPAVERVIPVALRRWRRNLRAMRIQGEWHAFREQLDAQRYDLVIDGQGLLKSAFVCSRVKAPSYGYDRHSIREPLASLFYTHKFAVAKDQHAVARLRQLFGAALGYTPSSKPIDCGIDRSGFGNTVAAEYRPYIVCLHGTTRADKYYPEDYWQGLMQSAAAGGYRLLLPWGNEEEQARAQRLAQTCDSATVLPRMNLAEIAGVLAGAAGVVAVDTGLGHLTAALGTPAVSLYGPTSPGLVGAYGKHQHYLEASDFGEGFSALTPEIVWQTLQQAMAEAAQ